MKKDDAGILVRQPQLRQTESGHLSESYRQIPSLIAINPNAFLAAKRHKMHKKREQRIKFLSVQI
jgi:hypothetical protein